jgi:hypothetical protein
MCRGEGVGNAELIRRPRPRGRSGVLVFFTTELPPSDVMRSAQPVVGVEIQRAASLVNRATVEVSAPLCGKNRNAMMKFRSEWSC